jgi:site-specific DNA recombinase
LAEAADMYADGEVSRAGHERIVSRVQRQLDQVLSQMTNTSSSALLGVVDRKHPRAAWDALSVERRRAVVDELMTVTILPSGKRGNGFDPRLLQIDWRRR